MAQTSASPDQVEVKLAAALELADDPHVKYHIREALQRCKIPTTD